MCSLKSCGRLERSCGLRQLRPAVGGLCDRERPSKRRPGCRRTAGRDATLPAPALAALLRRLTADGLIYFQDEGSQMVAQLIGAGGHDRVLDVCAAPGSKSTLIAALAPEAFIIAGDLYEHRAYDCQKIRDYSSKTTFIRSFTMPRANFPFTNGSFDRVLVDAPCSGTGTLRQNPEIRWRLQPSDIAELSAEAEEHPVERMPRWCGAADSSFTQPAPWKLTRTNQS